MNLDATFHPVHRVGGRPPSPIDLAQVQKAAEDGLTMRQAAERLGVSVTTLKRRVRDCRSPGTAAPVVCRMKGASPWTRGAKIDLSPRDLEQRAIAGRTKTSVASELGISRDAFVRAIAKDRKLAMAWARGQADRATAIARAEGGL